MKNAKDCFGSDVVVRSIRKNLTYLIKHCTGKVYEPIFSWVINRTPKEAYRQARHILIQQSGDELCVVNKRMKFLLKFFMGRP